MKEKIIYFYSAIYYTAWRWNLKCDIFVNKAVTFIFRIFISKLCTENCKNRIIEAYKDNLLGIEKMLKYPEKELKDVPCGYGYMIVPFFYMIIPMVPLLALDDAYIKFKYPIVIPLIFIFVPYLIISHYIDKILETNNRLSKNAKKFGKKDKEWHRKWNWINLIFSITPFILFILSLKLATLITDSAR